MTVHVQVPINATPEAIWKVITNIEHATEHISGIEKVEILEKPKQGLIGLKWRETRTLFGKTATEVMWITEAEPHQYYRTRAESHGSVYTTDLYISEEQGATTLNMQFGAEPQTFGARVMSALMGWMMKSATKKALLKDLEDIKQTVEQQ